MKLLVEIEARLEAMQDMLIHIDGQLLAIDLAIIKAEIDTLKWVLETEQED